MILKLVQVPKLVKNMIRKLLPLLLLSLLILLDHLLPLSSFCFVQLGIAPLVGAGLISGRAIVTGKQIGRAHV